MDSVKSSYTHKSYTQPCKPSGSTSSFKSNKTKIVEKSDKVKPLERVDKSKVSATTKCFQCQGYGHVTSTCSSPFKISLIDENPVDVTNFDTEDFTFHPGSDSEEFDF